MLVVVVAFTFTVGIGYTQRRGGQGMGMPRYDKSTEVTISGTVEKVESPIGKMGWNGTHLIVRLEAETLTVHVGPTAYVTKNGFAFAESDKIEVTGSKVPFEGHDVVLAREIRKDGKLLTLRNRQGIPMWSRNRWHY